MMQFRNNLQRVGQSDLIKTLREVGIRRKFINIVWADHPERLKLRNSRLKTRTCAITYNNVCVAEVVIS